MSLRTEIEFLGFDLDIGESHTGLQCPFCHGGRSGEKTFSITRIEDGLLHNCYRASCTDGRGFVPTAAVLRDPNKPRDRTKPDKPYYGTYEPLETKDIEYFLERFDLDLPTGGPIGLNAQNQYVQGVFNPSGLVRGYAIRRGGWTGFPHTPRFVNRSGPKTEVYMNNSQQIPQSWYWPILAEEAGRFVLVEDVISALKVAQAGLTGVSLLGVGLGNNKVREIGMQRPTEVLIALDADATSVSFTMAREWGLAFPTTRVIILERDLKDVSREEVRRILA